MTVINESFDAGGNALQVADLTFVEGILGQGAFATVRLAHRLGKSGSLTPPESSHKRLRREDYLLRSLSTASIDTFSSNSHEDDQLVAVKIFQKSILKRKRTMTRDSTTHRMKVHTALENVEHEIALMKMMRHPNLVALHDVIDSPESDMLYLVIDYMPQGEILTYRNDGTFRRKTPRPEQVIEGLKNGHFDEHQSALYFVDILHGLAYLHQNHICHRDLKPENILIDANGIAKISDFGVSHFFEEEVVVGVRRASRTEHIENPTSEKRLTRQETDSALAMSGMHTVGKLMKTEGTWCFWSPEMCGSSSNNDGTGEFSGYAADMWAAGICLYIFVTGQLPFYSEVPTDLFDLIAEAQVPYKGLGLSNTLVDLLKITLERGPSERAGVGNCLKHPFLQKARDQRIRGLNVEFETSRRKSVVVGEEEIKGALRTVTMVNPAEALKTVQKQLVEGFQAAKDHLSMLSKR